MRKKIDLIILTLVLITGVFGILNAQSLGDWWHARRYTPSAEVIQLADDSGMSEQGKKLFYRFSPQLLDQTELDTRCDNGKLGCAEGQSIYILAHTTETQRNQTTVTAAHEMLHIAYSRLDDTEREKIDALIKTELEEFDASGIVQKLRDYPAEEYYDEAHSFVGSELADISDELEAHYRRYFADRAKSTDAYSGSFRN